MFTPNQPKPAATLGAVQQNFVYRLRNFIINDQFTIVDDLPRTKPIRQAIKAGAKGQYTVYLIRISSGGFEADLELFEGELNQVAIACPKDTQNFKGITLAYDGRRWQYVCSEMPTPGTQQPQATYQAQPDPDANNKKLVGDMIMANKLDVVLDTKQMVKLAETIQPGKAIELIKETKDKGLIYEQAGIYKVA